VVSTVKKDLGQQFIDWLISPEGQTAIAGYKVNEQELFSPNANNPNAWHRGGRGSHFAADPLFVVVLAVIAAAYAAGGQAGATGYIAAMALVGFAPDLHWAGRARAE
jgi:hypothetical protein